MRKLYSWLLAFYVHHFRPDPAFQEGANQNTASEGLEKSWKGVILRSDHHSFRSWNKISPTHPIEWRQYSEGKMVYSSIRWNFSRWPYRVYATPCEECGVRCEPHKARSIVSSASLAAKTWTKETGQFEWSVDAFLIPDGMLTDIYPKITNNTVFMFAWSKVWFVVPRQHQQLCYEVTFPDSGMNVNSSSQQCGIFNWRNGLSSASLLWQQNHTVNKDAFSFVSLSSSIHIHPQYLMVLASMCFTCNYLLSRNVFRTSSATTNQTSKMGRLVSGQLWWIAFAIDLHMKSPPTTPKTQTPHL